MHETTGLFELPIAIWGTQGWGYSLAMAMCVAGMVSLVRATALASRCDPLPFTSRTIGIAMGLFMALAGAMQSGLGLSNLLDPVAAKGVLYGLGALGLGAIALVLPKPMAGLALPLVGVLATIALSTIGNTTDNGQHPGLFASVTMAVSFPVLAWAAAPWHRRLGTQWAALVWFFPIGGWILAQKVLLQNPTMFMDGSAWVLLGVMGLLLASERHVHRIWVVWAGAVFVALLGEGINLTLNLPQERLGTIAGAMVASVCALVYPLLRNRPPDWAIGVFYGAAVVLSLSLAHPSKGIHLVDELVWVAWPAVWLWAVLIAGMLAIHHAWKYEPANQPPISLPVVAAGVTPTLAMSGLLFLGTIHSTTSEHFRIAAFFALMVSAIVWVYAIQGFVRKRTDATTPPVAVIAIFAFGATLLWTFNSQHRQDLPHILSILMVMGVATALACLGHLRHAKSGGMALWIAALCWILLCFVTPRFFHHPTGIPIAAASIVIAVAGGTGWFAWKRTSGATLLAAMLTAWCGVVILTGPFLPRGGDGFSYLLAAGLIASVWAQPTRWAWTAWIWLGVIAFAVLHHFGNGRFETPEARGIVFLIVVGVVAFRKLDKHDTALWGWIYVLFLWALELMLMFFNRSYAKKTNEEIWIYNQNSYANNDIIFHTEPFHGTWTWVGSGLEWFGFWAFIVFGTGLSLWHIQQKPQRQVWVYTIWALVGLVAGSMMLIGLVTSGDNLFPYGKNRYGLIEMAVLTSSMALLGVCLWRGSAVLRATALFGMAGGALCYTEVGMSFPGLAAIATLGALGWTLIYGETQPRRVVWFSISVALGYLFITLVHSPGLWWMGVGAATIAAAWLAREGRPGLNLLAIGLATCTAAATISGGTP